MADTTPKLPTDGTTPQVEGLTPPATAVATAASEAPAFAASTTPDTAPVTSTPSLPAASKPLPPTQVAAAPATTTPAAGPYDPAAFKGDDPTDNAIAAVASNLRNAASQAEQTVTQTTSSLGSRYANVSTPPMDDLPDFSLADVAPAPAAVGGRYASTSVSPEAPSSLAAATPPATPETSLAPPSYPVATPPAPQGVQPAGGAIAAASSRVELTTGPGEYRPAGTGSYLGSVNVASRPQSETTPTGTPYPTTPQQQYR